MVKLNTVAGLSGRDLSKYANYESPAQCNAKINYALIEHKGIHYLVDPNGYTLFCSRFRLLRNLVAKFLTLPVVYDVGVVDG